MPFNEIGNITIAGNDSEPGKAYGGHIYSCSISIGNSSSPTTLTLNVVSEKGFKREQIDLIKKDIDLLPVRKIKIGDLDEINMYLIKYEIRKNVGSNILTLEYRDGSILLDKVFVGLINRHASKSSGEGQVKRITELSDGIQSGKAIVELSVNCSACEGNEVFRKRESRGGDNPGIYNDNNQLVVTATGKTLPPVKRDVDYASPLSKLKGSTDANYYFVPSDPNNFRRNGGALIVGRENFVENACDVPDVDYTFHDLIEAFKAGFISLKKINGEDSLKDRTYEIGPDGLGYTPYRRDYTGTLREVLNAWCSDFGYNFTWNIYKEEPEIIGISLTSNVASKKIENIRKAVEEINADKADKAVVESTVESYSKEGTFKQSYISQYLKPSKVKETNQRKFAAKTFFNVPVELIMQPAEWNARPLGDFVAHASLAKFAPEVRKSVLWGSGVPTFLKTLGYSGVTKLSPTLKQAIIAEWEFDQIGKILEQYGENFQLYVGFYNPDIAQYWEDFDRSIADGFIGRYYFRPVLKGELDEKGCITKAAFNHVTNMVGGGQVELFEWTRAESCFNFPYGKFVKNAYSHQTRMGAVLPYLRKKLGPDNLYQDAYPTDFIDRTTGQIKPEYQTEENIKSPEYKYTNGIWVFERDAVWGMHELHVRDAFNVANVDQILKMLPSNLPLEGRALNIFQDIALKTGSNNLVNQNYEQVLIVGPPPGANFNCSVANDALTLVPKVLDRARFDRKYFNSIFPNFNERVALSVNDQTIDGNVGAGNTATSDDCTTLCEATLIESICGTCEIDDEINRPYVGFDKFTHNEINADGNSIPKGTMSESFIVKPPRVLSRRVARVIRPCMADYQGYLELRTNNRITVDGAKNVYGSLLPVDGVNDTASKYENKTLGIKVVENNITNDVDQIVDPENSEYIINMIVPKTIAGNNDEKGNLKSIKPQDYHKEIEKYFNADALGVSEPNEEYSFSIAGLKFKDIGLDEFLSPDKGLKSMNISYGEQGITTSFIFSTRPAVAPNPMTFMKSLGPKLNTYGR